MEPEHGGLFAERLRPLLLEKFKAPENTEDIARTTRELIDHPLFRQYISSHCLVAIVDHSIAGYHYYSESAKNIFGVPASAFMEKGLALTFSLLHPADLPVVIEGVEKAASLCQGLSIEDRMHVSLNIMARYNPPRGPIVLHQQSLPIAFNDQGLPYLLLAICTEVSEFGIENGAQYKLVLNRPREAMKVLLSGGPESQPSPLTKRETEIVQLLSQGHDGVVIAKTLFISEGTVRTHRKNVLEKTKAKNSVHLIRMSLANGWI